jgi:hypothetical protein
MIVASNFCGKTSQVVTGKTGLNFSFSPNRFDLNIESTPDSSAISVDYRVGSHTRTGP